MQQFSLEGLEERLHLRIISALAGAIHAVPYPVLIQQSLCFVSAVFDATIRMEQQV
jgi:hypothetical protein